MAVRGEALLLLAERASPRSAPQVQKGFQKYPASHGDLDGAADVFLEPGRGGGERIF